MKKTIEPYEFLVRWRNGVVSGYHFKTLAKVIDDDGTVIHEAEGDAMSAEMAQAIGYDLTGIIGAVNLGALTACDMHKAECEAACAERDKAQQERDDAAQTAKADKERSEAAIVERIKVVQHATEVLHENKKLVAERDAAVTDKQAALNRTILETVLDKAKASFKK